MSGTPSETDTGVDVPAVISLQNRSSAWRQTREGGMYLTRNDPHGFVRSLADAERIATGSTVIEITAVGLTEIREKYGDDIVPVDYDEPTEGAAGADEYPVLKQTVDDFETDLATGEYDDDLDALADAERSASGRKGVADAIEERRETLSTESPETESETAEEQE